MFGRPKSNDETMLLELERAMLAMEEAALLGDYPRLYEAKQSELAILIRLEGQGLSFQEIHDFLERRGQVRSLGRGYMRDLLERMVSEAEREHRARHGRGSGG